MRHITCISSLRVARHLAFRTGVLVAQWRSLAGRFPNCSRPSRPSSRRARSPPSSSLPPPFESILQVLKPLQVLQGDEQPRFGIRFGFMLSCRHTPCPRHAKSQLVQMSLALVHPPLRCYLVLLVAPFLQPAPLMRGQQQVYVRICHTICCSTLRSSSPLRDVRIL